MTRTGGHPGVGMIGLAGLSLASFALLAPCARAEEQPQATGKGIGAITSVQGKVMMDHPDPDGPFQATTKESLQQNDVLQTHEQGRTKVLLDGGNLLTLGENSRVEILDHRHDPAQTQAATTVRLTQGSLRAMVGSAHATPGATFEVQTPTSRVVAHGGTLVVWVDGTLSGAANVGTAGTVEFTAGGQTARLEPGTFTHAGSGRPPAAATPLAAGAHPKLQDAIGATRFKESLKHEAPKDALREVGAPRALGLGLGGTAGQGQDLAASKDGSAGVDEAQGGGQSPSNKPQGRLHQQPATHAHPQTPPSVHSGSSGRLLRPNDSGPLRGEGRVRQ